MNTPGASGRLVSLNWRKVISRITIIVGIGMLFSLALPVLVSKPIGLRTLLAYHPGFLLLALAAGLLPLFLHAWTIHIWAAYFKKAMPGRDSINIAASAALGSAVTPTMLGGAPLKMGLLVLHGFRAGQAAAVTSLGSLQDALAFAVIILVSISVSESVSPDMLLDRIQGIRLHFSGVLLTGGIAALAAGGTWLLLTRTAWGRRSRAAARKGMGDLLDSYKMISRDGKGIFLVTTFINIARWACMYFVLVFLIMALKLPGADYLEIWSLQWIVFTGMTVTPLPGGAGGAEAAFYMVYDKMIPGELIFGLILLWRFFTAYLRMILAALLVIAFPLRTEAPSGK